MTLATKNTLRPFFKGKESYYSYYLSFYINNLYYIIHYLSTMYKVLGIAPKLYFYTKLSYCVIKSAALLASVNLTLS